VPGRCCRPGNLATRLLFIFLLAAPCLAQAQIDSVFWFAAPDLAAIHGDRPILLRIASFDSAAEITISQPANPVFVPITKKLAPNSATSVNLTEWVDLIENSSFDTVSNKGLLVKSSGLISVYYDIANSVNGDMFSLKGETALGTAFHVPFQNAWKNNYTTSSINIVAAQDGTTVTINPAKDIKGHKKGIPFTVVLNRGQSYTCKATSGLGAEHLAGTFITANKPIAISTHDDSVNPGVGPCLDTAGDQLIPDSKAGMDFIVLKGFLAAPDNFYVLAIHDNTIVQVDGQPVDTLAEGESYRNIMTNSTAHVTASKPVHLFHISGFGCEVGGAVIPTITCTGSKAVSITRATTQFLSVNIVVPTAIIGFFTFNNRKDVITASRFLPVPGTSGAWSYAKLELSTADFPVGTAASIRNSAGKFQLGFIHGDQASTCRYAYFSAFSEGDLEVSVSPPPHCQGSNVMLQAKSSLSEKFVWRGPNGFTATGNTVQLNNIMPSASGYYVVSTIGAECSEKKDSIYIEVNGLRLVRSSFYLCAGQSHQTPSGKVISTGGEHRDTLRYTSGCDSIIYIYAISIKPVPVLVVSKSNDVTCQLGAVQLAARGAATYHWSPAQSLSNALVSNPVARPAAATRYIVTGTAANGCSATDSIQVSMAKDYEGSGHDVPSAFTPNGDGRNDCFGVPYWGWVEDFSMLVYNRWGDLVFKTSNGTQCWDGTVGGRQVQTDVFVYLIKANTSCGPIERKGTVTLLR
jgi:gliding motility-associated-like protein